MGRLLNDAMSFRISSVNAPGHAAAPKSKHIYRTSLGTTVSSIIFAASKAVP